jgi:hypothetical protein
MTDQKTKEATEKLNQWIAAENAARVVPNLTIAIEEVAESINDFNNLKSDFTGWNIIESIDNLALEMKRSNDLKEKELGL